jgi:hypothetical protein
MVVGAADGEPHERNARGGVVDVNVDVVDVDVDVDVDVVGDHAAKR